MSTEANRLHLRITPFGESGLQGSTCGNCFYHGHARLYQTDIRLAEQRLVDAVTQVKYLE